MNVKKKSNSTNPDFLQTINSIQHDGYAHENGEYAQELSAAIIMIGATKENVNSVAADLCCFPNQESVLVEAHKSAFHSVSELLNLEDC